MIASGRAFRFLFFGVEVADKKEASSDDREPFPCSQKQQSAAREKWSFLESFHLQKRVYRAFSRQYLHNLFMEIEREAAGEENDLKEMHTTARRHENRKREVLGARLALQSRVSRLAFWDKVRQALHTPRDLEWEGWSRMDGN